MTSKRSKEINAANALGLILEGDSDLSDLTDDDDDNADEMNKGHKQVVLLAIKDPKKILSQLSMKRIQKMKSLKNLPM